MIRTIAWIGLAFIVAFFSITAVIRFTRPQHEPLEQSPTPQMVQPTLPVPENLH
jgi:hypothetical protein